MVFGCGEEGGGGDLNVGVQSRLFFALPSLALGNPST